MNQDGRLIHKFIRLRDNEQPNISVFISEFKEEMDSELVFKLGQIIYGAMIDYQYVSKEQIIIFSFLFRSNGESCNTIVFQVEALSEKAEKLNRDKNLMNSTIYRFLTASQYANSMEIYSVLYPNTGDDMVKMSVHALEPNRQYLSKLLSYFDENNHTMDISHDVSDETNIDSIIIDEEKDINS